MSGILHGLDELQMKRVRTLLDTFESGALDNRDRYDKARILDEGGGARPVIFELKTSLYHWDLSATATLVGDFKQLFRFDPTEYVVPNARQPTFTEFPKPQRSLFHSPIGAIGVGILLAGEGRRIAPMLVEGIATWIVFELTQSFPQGGTRDSEGVLREAYRASTAKLISGGRPEEHLPDRETDRVFISPTEKGFNLGPPGQGTLLEGRSGDRGIGLFFASNRADGLLNLPTRLAHHFYSPVLIEPKPPVLLGPANARSNVILKL